jgi:aminodeoxyfutalosine deaminase
MPAVSSIDDLIAALPKAELHVHLEGSMPPELLLRLGHKHGLDQLPQSLQAVADWYEFRDFQHFIDVYVQAINTLRDEEDFALLVTETAAKLAAQNVRYAEVIFTPTIHTGRGIPAEVVFDGIEHGRKEAERDHGIVLRWLPDFPGHYGLADGERALDLIAAADLESIIGFNVGGIEVDRDQFGPLFRRAKSTGLHSVPHAGETEGPEQVWSAIRSLGAERIGHGIGAMTDPELVAYLRDRQLPIDVCPTSNLRTRIVGRLAEHPLPHMLDAGLLVTLNSDDPPMFGTDLIGEYRAAHTLGLDADVLTQLARNGVQAAFLDDPAKAKLTAEIDSVHAAWQRDHDQRRGASG